MKAYVCLHVFTQTRRVLLVIHHEDGDWSFMCGHTDHGGAEDIRVVGVGHLVAADPSLHACADLPNGYEAERNAVGDSWLRGPTTAAAS